MLYAAPARGQFLQNDSTAPLPADADANLFATWSGSDGLDGVTLDLPRGWDLLWVRVLRNGYEPAQAQLILDEDHEGRYTVSFPRTVIGPLVFVFNVKIGDDLLGTSDWLLTPLVRRDGELDDEPAEALLVPTRVERALSSGDNRALVFSKQDEAPILLKWETLPDLGLRSPFTLQFWMRTTGLGDVVLSAWDGDEEVPYPFEVVVGVDGQLFCYQGRPGDHRTMMTQRPVADGRWHHVALTNDPEEGWSRLFVDGHPADSLFHPMPLDIELRSPVAVGGRVPDGKPENDGFVGMIDELQFWSQARSAANIRSTMNQPLQSLGGGVVALGFETPLPDELLAPHSGRATRLDAGPAFYQPVHNLRGAESEQNVELTWDTRDGQTTGFVVERSRNGSDFEAIGRVAAREASPDEDDLAYRFQDELVSGHVLFYRIRQQFKTGAEKLSGTIKMGVGVEEKVEEATLIGNFPNPFNPQTTVTYVLQTPQHVRLSVWDLAGQQVALLVDEDQAAGFHEVPFVANDLPSGTYFIRMRIPGGAQVRQMILMK